MVRRTVGEAMTPDPIMLDPATAADRAVEVMRDRRIHHLLVQGGDGIVNVVCLCDLLGQDPLDDSFEGVNRRRRGAPLSAFARRRTVVVGTAEGLEAAAELMAGEGIGCLPVVEKGRVVGILTRSDLVDRSELDPDDEPLVDD